MTRLKRCANKCDCDFALHLVLLCVLSWFRMNSLCAIIHRALLLLAVQVATLEAGGDASKISAELPKIRALAPQFAETDLHRIALQ